jgi:hypothetical protein
LIGKPIGINHSHAQYFFIPRKVKQLNPADVQLFGSDRMRSVQALVLSEGIQKASSGLHLKSAPALFGRARERIPGLEAYPLQGLFFPDTHGNPGKEAVGGGGVREALKRRHSGTNRNDGTFDASRGFRHELGELNEYVTERTKEAT